MSLKERMPALLEMRRQHLVTLAANAADPVKDRDGCSSSAVKGTLRFLGVAEFAVSRDVALFRRHLSDAARIQQRFFERREQGEPIDDSYVAMLSYQELFDGLAAGDFHTAEQLAQLMGGRNELEKKHDHPFDYCLGYTLKAFVERKPDAMSEWASKFAAICRRAGNADFAGYAEVFNSILAHDAKRAQGGLAAIVKGHKNQSRRGVFRDTEDETLCVWGIGIVNLARRSGLAIDGEPPLIPPELLL